MLRQTLREATGYETAVSGQADKLRLIEHLKLDDGRCPVCDAQNIAGQAMAEQIRNSLSIVANDVFPSTEYALVSTIIRDISRI